MIALSKREEFDYVLEQDRELPKEKQTVFRLRPLTLRESNEIEDLIGLSHNANGVPIGSVNYKAIKYGLAGCQNLISNSGIVVPFEKDGQYVSDAFLEKLPVAVRSELANEVLKTQEVLKEEIKN